MLSFIWCLKYYEYQNAIFFNSASILFNLKYERAFGPCIPPNKIYIHIYIFIYAFVLTDLVDLQVGKIVKSITAI